MGSAKVASLKVTPLQASHLCFETSGILEQPSAQLGDTVNAFDFAAFYTLLGSMPTASSADPSRLEYDFQQIQAAVSSFRLVSLRAEPVKAALDKAINARQNAYFAKYGNAPTIISQINEFYSPSVVDSKPNRLAILSALADNQANALKAAYTSDGRLGVVKTTGSVLASTTTSEDTATTTSQDTSTTTSQDFTSQSGTTSQTGQTVQQDLNFGAITSGNIPDPPESGGFPPWHASAPVGLQLQESTDETGGTTSGSSQSQGRAFSASQGQASSETEGQAVQAQTIVNTDYGYRMPFFESQAQNQRAQISLIDQQFAQFMYGQNLPNLAAVFQNELNSIDADVYSLQIAYLNTILMSPIAGTVTGIYKNPGDAVRAGEPVLRVEDSSVILLAARLIYPGRISLGSTVTVQTPLFEQPGPLTTITGNVVAIRGECQDNQWEVIVKCNNLDSASNPILPLGYHFDYDDTTITIS
jgi:biotin carboxyl carrier protein